MIDVSNQYKKAIKQPSRLLKSIISINNKTFTDTDIFSITYNEDLFMESEFTIGTAIMSCVEIELRSSQAIYDNFLEGKEMEVKIGIEISSNKFEYVSLGFFIIEDIEKEKFVTKIYANDRMVKFEKNYETKLSFPASMKDIALDVAKKAGVELITDTFVNCDYTIKSKPNLTDVTLRKALMYIAELAGGYARITRDGCLEIFNIENTSENTSNYASETYFSNELIANEIHDQYNTITGDNLITFSNKGFATSKIDKLVFEIPNLESEMGDGKNVYYIVDNLFCHNPDDVIENIYNVITKINYVPYEGKLQGDPALQVGDNVSIKNDGGLINTIITNRSLSYMGGLTEEYQAVGISTTEKHSTGKGSVEIEIDKTKTEIIVMAGEIEQKVSNEDFESTIKQTTDNITLEIKNTKEGLESKIEQTTDSITLEIKNNKEELESKIEQTADSITLEVKNNKEELESKIEQTAESITLEVQNNKDELISKIEQTAESITLEVQNNKDELESRIEQTAESITAEIKNNKDELESRIEQTTESITAEIKNNKDELESRIEQTAESLTSEITNNKEELESRIEQTTKNLTSEIRNNKEELESKFEQTVDKITSEIKDNKNGLESQITQTKDNLEAKITDAKNNLQSQITLNKNSISQKVESEEFKSYKKQTDKAIESKIEGKDVSTIVKQGADSWGLSINGKLKGTNYNFTGDKFIIGEQNGTNKSYHTPTQSQWGHNDGSFTRVNADGIYRYSAGAHRFYHYLMHIGTVQVRNTVWVNLPSHIANKVSTYSVSISARAYGFDDTTTVALMQLYCAVLEKKADKFAIRVDMYGWKPLKDDWRGKQTWNGWVNVDYVIIA